MPILYLYKFYSNYIEIIYNYYVLNIMTPVFTSFQYYTIIFYIFLSNYDDDDVVGIFSAGHLYIFFFSLLHV